jgi:hypothetical protein
MNEHEEVIIGMIEARREKGETILELFNLLHTMTQAELRKIYLDDLLRDAEAYPSRPAEE